MLGEKGRVEIYCDNLQEGRWFASLSHHLAGSNMKKIGVRNANIPAVDRLLRYDRPDIIVLVDGEPKLVVEKTSEVPTGHNVGQRFGRFANAVEEGVMVVYFLPFTAMKHGKYAGVCYVPARLFIALERMEAIHGVPALAVNWPCDDHYELLRDGSQDVEMKELVNGLIESQFTYSEAKIIDDLREIMKKELEDRVRVQPNTADPPSSVKIIDTQEYVELLKKKFPADFQNVSSDFQSRKKTLVYQLGMTPENCRREDPYTGTQFLYDYIWCRNGPNPSDKHTNLVLSVPNVTKGRWMEANPNDPSRKSAVYYATANIIVLKDGIIKCESKVGPNSNIKRLDEYSESENA
jgi:hypothetical protein